MPDQQVHAMTDDRLAKIRASYNPSEPRSVLGALSLRVFDLTDDVGPRILEQDIFTAEDFVAMDKRLRVAENNVRSLIDEIEDMEIADAIEGIQDDF